LGREDGNVAHRWSTSDSVGTFALIWACVQWMGQDTTMHDDHIEHRSRRQPQRRLQGITSQAAVPARRSAAGDGQSRADAGI